MEKQPFFIELYNLHLSVERPPTEEEKQQFIKTILTYHEMPILISTNEGKTFEKQENKTINVYSEGGAWLTDRGVYFIISKDRFGYCSSTLDWWEIDYPSFLEEYAHLRSFIDGYLEKKFTKDDQTWFRKEVLQLFTLEFIYNPGGKLTNNSSFEFENDTQRKEFATVCICPNTPQMTANQFIIVPAYWELIDVIRTRVTIKQCIAYETRRKAPCSNIFIDFKKQGPPQQFCSERCRKRIYEHEKKHPEDKKKRRAILDAKMENKR